MRQKLAQAITLLIIFLPTSASAEPLTLVMFETEDCDWCFEWHKQIGSSYKKSNLGKRAPLRRMDIRTPIPTDLKLENGIMFTPTFVLVENGQEIGRILGFSGDYQFWGQLENLISRLRKKK